MTTREVMRKLFPGERRWRAKEAIGAINWMLPSRWRAGGRDGRHAVPIKGLIPGMAVHYAPCCHPLPGDRIVGIVTKGSGVMVHTIDCVSLEQFADESERWLDVKWDVEATAPGLYVGRIIVIVANEPGSLSNLSSIVAKNMGNISNLRITDRRPDFFEMMIDIEVADVKHLTNIITALRTSPQVGNVERVRG